jgi:hypothetical protein
MCDLCDELDAKIERYKRLADPALDARTLKQLRDAIEALEAEKSGIQCKGEKPERQI